MKRFILGLMTAALAAGTLASAQGPTPYKLGTFERQGRTFVGVVLRDSVVIDLGAANAAIRTPAATVPAPADMKDLIVRYDTGVKARIADIVASVERGANGARPAYVYDLKALKTLPPIMYPTTMMNVAVNYRDHELEMRPPAAGQAAAPGTAPAGTQGAPGIWQRAADDKRWNPYMFLKAPAAIVANEDAIRIPPGRVQIDWECEMGVVIGRQGLRVPLAEADRYIFGYTIENDVSDRGGRGDNRYGSDWMIHKSHDTFAPMGPFIVPKEFIANVKNLTIKSTLNGQPWQDANTSLMIHDVFEQVMYASNIMTVRPGDVIATGSPAGVGAGRTPPVFLKAGDRTVCTYEGVGTLSNPVVGS